MDHKNTTDLHLTSETKCDCSCSAKCCSGSTNYWGGPVAMSMRPLLSPGPCTTSLRWRMGVSLLFGCLFHGQLLFLCTFKYRRGRRDNSVDLKPTVEFLQFWKAPSCHSQLCHPSQSKDNYVLVGLDLPISLKGHDEADEFNVPLIMSHACQQNYTTLLPGFLIYCNLAEEEKT